MKLQTETWIHDTPIQQKWEKET